MRSTAKANNHSRTLRASIMRTAQLAALLGLTACATQPPSTTTPAPTSAVISADQLALRTMASQQDRLYRVAAPLLVRNADLCKGDARNLFGFTAKNKYSYSSELADAAQTVLGLGEQLQVVGVLNGGGAERAGLLPGDKLLAVEGKPMPAGAGADRQAAVMLAPFVAPAAARSALQLTVLRGDAKLNLNIPLTRACAYSIELGNADLVNAYADGRRVLITRGMMNFTQSDAELAYVLSREIAHNALRHAARQNISGTAGDIIENLTRIRPDLSTMAGTAGLKPMPRELDADADRLALYMATRAGYGLEGAGRFWERLAGRYPASTLNGYTALHPDTTSRMEAIERTTSEIRRKLAERKPLLP